MALCSILCSTCAGRVPKQAAWESSITGYLKMGMLSRRCTSLIDTFLTLMVLTGLVVAADAVAEGDLPLVEAKADSAMLLQSFETATITCFAGRCLPAGDHEGGAPIRMSPPETVPQAGAIIEPLDAARPAESREFCFQGKCVTESRTLDAMALPLLAPPSKESQSGDTGDTSNSAHLCSGEECYDPADQSRIPLSIALEELSASTGYRITVMPEHWADYPVRGQLTDADGINKGLRILMSGLDYYTVSGPDGDLVLHVVGFADEGKISDSVAVSGMGSESNTPSNGHRPKTLSLVDGLARLAETREYCFGGNCYAIDPPMGFTPPDDSMFETADPSQGAPRGGWGSFSDISPLTDIPGKSIQ